MLRRRLPNPLGYKKPVMNQDPELIRYLLLLRFGNTKVTCNAKPILGFASIAKLVRIHAETVRRLIAQGLKELDKGQKARPPPRVSLTQEHLNFLCSKNTLNAWAHLSLEQRVIMFHRQFPELRITITILRKIYKKNGIKFKFIRRGKKDIDFKDPHYLNLFTDMHRALRTTRHKDIKLFWVDEAMFTFNTFRKRAWAGRGHNITINDADYFIKAQAMVCAISEDGGLEAYHIHEKSVTSSDFSQFIQVLSERAGGREFAIFMDNLRVHKTQEVAEACKKVGAKVIFNVPYSPDFNGIEAYFSQVKGEYKKLILQKLVKGIKPDVINDIHQSMKSVPKDKVQACVMFGLKNIQVQAKHLSLE